MLEFVLSYNDGQCVECLAVNNPRVVELINKLDDRKHGLIMADHDYCVILNNRPVGSFKTAMKLNNADIVFAALKFIDESISEQKDALKLVLELIREAQNADRLPIDPKSIN